jgi:hypothetical protein
VTGIDFVQKALTRAHDEVRQAGVEMRLIQGDVTALPEAGVGSGFRLIVDTGTLVPTTPSVTVGPVAD